MRRLHFACWSILVFCTFLIGLWRPVHGSRIMDPQSTSRKAENQAVSSFHDPQPEAELPWPEGHGFERILFMDDSRHLVALGLDRGTRDAIVDFWDIATKKHVHAITQPGNKVVWAAAFSPDGKRLVTAGQDDKVYVYSALDWKLEAVFERAPAQRLVFLPDGKRFVSGGRFGARLWDVGKGEAIGLGPREERQVTGLALSRGGNRFAVAYSAPLSEIWDVEKLEVVGRLELPKSPTSQGVFNSVVFSPDGKTLATGYQYNRTHPVAIWDAMTSKKLHDCYGFDKRAVAAQAIAYSADSKLVLACNGPDDDQPAHIIIWEVQSGKVVYQFKTGKGGMNIALSPDGRWLVHVSGGDYTIRVWDFDKIRKEIAKGLLSQK